ncbi:DUF1631 family protein [Montanilutibacter psychrotolerans]|uniref:DUF1631 domain-containing protein n=1 Tax=Montanilutibacter psychrotolerans TaxID=1327343 RepID=A0A3M8T2Y5_9GAMM|nr:DUF1631 family protein [Lysobacter psychrotolerans]RNF85884.1 DUF1631 domain-containing protein [Lysobacter psychrotolerans]
MSTLPPPTAPMRPTSPRQSLPRRVQRTLDHLHDFLAEELGRHVEKMLDYHIHHLLRQAEQTTMPVLQAHRMTALEQVQANRGALRPRLFGELGEAFAALRTPELEEIRGVQDAIAPIVSRELRLVDESVANESAVLRAIAARQEARAGLSLMLLGMRFGVLAATPAFDAERLPVGPRQLGLMLSRASSHALQLDEAARIELYESFETTVMSEYAQMVDTMNALLARENVLPSLSFVPLRARPRAQNEPVQTAHAKRQLSAAPSGVVAPRAHTGWFGDAEADSPSVEDAAMARLSELLMRRRELAGAKGENNGDPTPTIATDALTETLERQQARIASGHAGGARTPDDIRLDVLAQGRQQAGHAIRLSREDNDAFELVSMLYDQIGRELRAGTSSTSLLERLQVPLLRVALRDQAFFVHHQHPARRLLDVVAEAGANWISEDEVDPQLDTQLHRAVNHVVQNYHGDASVFAEANQPLQEHLQLMARKAEIAERRHVEAARGKEKLELAKQRAGEIIVDSLHGREVPPFVRRLLQQPWQEALTLTLLRNGEGSPQWRSLRQITDQIVDVCSGEQEAPPDLCGHVEQALELVGYQGDDALVIARRLTAIAETADDPVSRTELAMRLKARTRLGELPDALRGAPTAPRTPEAQACFDQLRTLPFGSWLEFAGTGESDVVRRRLAWYSPVTESALFVNQRGQRIGEQSLDSVARLMAQGLVRVVPATCASLVDRAWQVEMMTLRSLNDLAEPNQDRAPE